MKVTISRAAKRADQIVAAIADRLNGNAARRRTIKQRLAVAMMATERHQLVAARTAQSGHAVEGASVIAASEPSRPLINCLLPTSGEGS